MKHFFLIFLSICGLWSNTFANNEHVRSMVHTLDYLARDYHRAVENGKIIDQAEYEEMQDFSASLAKQVAELHLAAQDSTAIEINNIKLLIEAKAATVVVAEKANALRKKLIATYKVTTAPTVYPNIKNGKLLYQAECASCHGENGFGDGIAGKGLVPEPRNFHEVEAMRLLSPFSVFNTIRVGIEGTGMVANTKLTDDEVWDLAFYTLSMRHKNVENNKIPQLNLSEIAILPDEELEEEGWSVAQIAALRNRLPENANNMFLSRAEELLKEALAAYKNADVKTAERLAIAAYLEGVEPVEIHLKKVNEDAAEDVEENVTKVRLLIGKKAPLKEVEDATATALLSIKTATTALEESGVSFWMAFSLTLIILLREGLEAFLIIMVLLVILSKAGLNDRKKYVHLGWIAAIVLGTVLWLLSGKLIQSSMSHVELMEGIIGLTAVFVLVYVGFWLHRKSKADEWRKYVSDLVAKANGGGSIWGLASLSFIVAFREVFESLLFLSALQVQSKGTQSLALGSGIAVAAVIILVLAFLSLKYSAKLPIQNLFKISAFTISLLAFVLAGKSIHSFQEAGLVSIHKLPIPAFDILGIFNTWETIGAQVLVLVVIYILQQIITKK
ncbi:MAG: FTR1 family protein [Chitinophagales bacterium]|nr:FTR1 family protein [Chitinophagales bacterium]MCO5281158.1 FTR1 family protein [Chitinophagales bacterium]